MSNSDSVDTNYRAQMLAKIKGENDGKALFIPRLDIWYNANKAQQTLPEEISKLSLLELTRHLGVGFHSVIPDFVRTGNEEDIFHRGLGFYNNPDFPYHVDFSAVDYLVERSDSDFKVTYRTSLGDVTTRMEYGAVFARSGMSIPGILEHAAKTEEDYARLAEIYSKIKIIPRPERYNAYRDRVGESGLAICFISLACGPVCHIQRDLRRMDEFFFDMNDFPETVAMLADVLGGLYDQMIAAALMTAAETVIFGANYDDMITVPPLFREHFLPWLQKVGDAMHAKGKFVLTHTDGENALLMKLYTDARFDVADSITPAPMTKLSLAEYRKQFGDKVTIWGGIPSIAMLESTMDENSFRSFVELTIEEARPFNNLIFSVADTCPPQAPFHRIKYLTERLAKEREDL